MCEEAGCPNIYECWEDREATFLIGGEQCTRRCDFCQIDTGKPAELDRDEPRRVAESVAGDGAAVRHGHRRRPRRPARRRRVAVRRDRPRRSTAEPGHRRRDADPRLQRQARPARQVFESRPEVLAHNVETVPRIFKRIRPAFRYERCLDVLDAARDYGLVTKSNLILGMGETPDEVAHGAARSARRRLRHRHHHPVPAPVAAPPPRRAVGQAGGVRRARGVRRASSASPACWPGRWCGRRTGPAGCTPRQRRRAVSRPTRILIDGKTPQTPPSQGREGRGEGRPQGASKQRRSQLWQAFQMQRKEDKRLLPYMIGAFVLIVAAAVVAGVFVGGFTMFMLIPLGIVLGALVAFIIFGRRAQKSVYSKAEGQTGRGRVGAGEPAGQVAGDPGRRGDRPSRRGAPGDRPARRHLRRRGLGRSG